MRFNFFKSLFQLHELPSPNSSSSSKNLSPLPSLTCGFCTKTDFPSLEALQLHVQAVHLPMPTPSDLLGLGAHSPLLSPLLMGAVRQASSPSTNGGYTCEYCTMIFVSVHALQKHTLSVHSFHDLVNKLGRLSPFCCQHCSKTFPSPGLLLDHQKSAHPDDATRTSPKHKEHSLKRHHSSKSSNNGASPGPPSKKVSSPAPAFNGTHFPPSSNTLLCSQCNAAFPDFESFRTHLKIHLDAVVQKFTCSECEGEFTTEELLDAHVATHFLATATEYGCQCCLKLFSKPDELQKHLMDIHAHHLFRCSLCKDMFDSKVSIQVHFAVKHSNECRLFKCTQCKAVFRSEMEFQLHVKVNHLCKLQPFRCLLCNQCFTNDLQLQFHLSTHKKEFPCTLCDEAFHVEFLLDKHVQMKHSGEAQSTQMSSQGSLSPGATDVAQNLSLKSRSRRETDQHSSERSNKESKCDICDSSFPTESALATHRRQVHNIRMSGFQKAGQTTLSLFCAYCNETCKSRTELENHMKTHTATPSKHKCNICDEVCPSASTLAEHKLTHCKVISGSTCVTCRLNLKTEEQFYGHVQQHNQGGGLPVPCVVCRQTLMSEVEVQMHAKFHLKCSEPLQFSCCVCGQLHEASNLIITGKQDGGHTYMCKECFHTKGDSLNCGECKVKFETLAELEKHRSTGHPKTYQCIKCQMSFETEADIQLHVTTHVMQEGNIHECRLCHKVLDSPSKLQCHLIEHTFEGCSSFSCYMCSSVFTSASLLQQHMLDHGLASRPYDCNQCHQRFFFRAELENHASIHGTNGMIVSENENELQCTECLKVFSSLVNLEKHQMHEHHTNTLKCSACPKVFNNSSDMQEHYFSCHDEGEVGEDKKCFTCTECEKEFPCMSNLQGHMRIHTGGTKYTCTECSKEFALSRNLSIHMRSHSGEKPYECPICKKRFARKENRKAHLKSHIGLKPFMCPHCGKTFSRKCHVKEHMRTHITSTTHPCEECSDTFPATRQLRRHMAEVHNKKYDHVCSVCGDVFEVAKSLDHHMKRAHDVRIGSSADDGIGEDLSDSSPTSRSSTSGDQKDLDGSECSSYLEDLDNLENPDSPVSVISESVSVVPPPEIAA